MKKTRSNLHKVAQKRQYKCSAKKAKLLIEAYRKTGGSIVDIAKSTGISRRQVYNIFDAYPNVREEIDSLDAAKVEGLREKALTKLEENIDANLQSAIQYALEKEPRKERGKIVINKDDYKGLDIELYLGVRQEVIIE